MDTSRSLALILVYLSLMPIVSHAELARGHCAAEETVVFSCITGTKVVSVCVASKADNRRSYLQYRYGALGSPEVVLPSLNQLPGHNTDAMSYINPIGDGNGYIRFRSGAYSYIAYAFSSRENFSTKGSAPGWNSWHGVVIERDGRIKRVLRCKSSFGVQSKIEPSFLATHVDFLAPSNDSEEVLDRVSAAVTKVRPD